MSFYGIKKGKKKGVYSSWAECFPLVFGYRNAEFKKFDTEDEAFVYINQENNLQVITKQVITKQIHIYTDGSCRNNGYKNAKAGIGVYFGKDDSRNVSEMFTDNPTSQRAELYAIIKAIELLTEQEHKYCVIIHTDSMYSINCITKWCKNWIKNGWRTTTKKPIKNKKLIERLYYLYNQYNVKLEHIRAHTGNKDIHSVGNDVADKLAVIGGNS